MRVPLATILGLALLWAAGGGGPAAPAQATEIISGRAQVLQVEINKGQLVRLDRPAATVFIADPEIADIQVKSPTLVYVFGNMVGETTLFAVDERERVLTNLAVNVVHDLTRLDAALEALLPGADISALSIDGALVLSGNVASATEAEDARRLAARFLGKDEEIINRIGVTGPNQVNLRVRVVEVSRDVMKEFGFNWDALATIGNFAFALGTGNPVIVPGVLGVFRNPSTAIDNAFLGYNTGNVQFNTVIDAMADEGLISVLAEPNLTALSGETASFLAGGEFPIPVPQDRNRITIEFKKFGVSLSFTPTLLGNNLISLRVRPEVSQLTNTGEVKIDGFTIPALTTRRAETTIELASGQSFAIAGLLQNNVTHDLSKFPGLADLPVFGPLFQSDKFRRNETELVIVVTPYIVRPVSGVKMAVPTDGLVPPSDVERIILGRQYRPQLQVDGSAPVGPETERLSGPSGFMLE